MDDYNEYVLTYYDNNYSGSDDNLYDGMTDEDLQNLADKIEMRVEYYEEQRKLERNNELQRLCNAPMGKALH